MLSDLGRAVEQVGDLLSVSGLCSELLKKPGNTSPCPVCLLSHAAPLLDRLLPPSAYPVASDQAAHPHLHTLQRRL